MSWSITYLPDARDDVDRAYASYEQRKAGLGERFLDRLRHRVEVICGNPEIYAVVRGDVRAAALKQFPYVVCYRFEQDRVFVIAVLHGHRNPEIWRDRG